MSLPEGWGARTNASAPEGAVQIERPADWTAHTLLAKYDPAVLDEGPGSAVPLGWSKRSAHKTLVELSQSTSATVIAVAEVHDKAMSPEGSIFQTSVQTLATQLEANKPRTAGPSAAAAAPAAAAAESAEERAALKATLDNTQQMISLLANLVIKMDAKLNEIDQQQKLILSRLGPGPGSGDN